MATFVTLAAALVAGAGNAGAADFGPVDPGLADGAPGSLRDVIDNQATNQGVDGVGCVPSSLGTCGDLVELVPGATYTLTCAGGGTLVHGNTPLWLAARGIEPAVIEQTCPGNRILDQGVTEQLVLENVVLNGPFEGQMSAVCFSAGAGPVTSRTWGTITGRHDERIDLPDQERYSTRVLGVLRGATDQVVFDELTPNPSASAEAQALFEAARAVVAAYAAAVGGPELVEQSDTSSTHVEDVYDRTGVSTSHGPRFGPATFLIGNELSETHFIPAGCIDVGDFTQSVVFVERQFQTTVTHHETYQVTGIVATGPGAGPVAAAPTFTG